jgi:hypothetical protein
VVAAYAVGWPIVASRAAAETGLPPCTAPDQPHCLVGWLSFAEPADPTMLLRRLWPLARHRPATDPLLCVNPLTGTPGGAAPRGANRGTLLPDEDDSDAERAGPLAPGGAGALRAHGLLLIGPPPEIGLFVLPGNTYHVYDIPLFWANLRADALRRSATWHRAGRRNPMITQSTADAARRPADGWRADGARPRHQDDRRGAVRCWLALCHRRQTVIRRKFAQDKAALAAIVAERSVKGLVIGLPLNMDGSDGPRSQSARAMARNLADLGLPILMWDERWSTRRRSGR